jgi:hypothetical protein
MPFKKHLARVFTDPRWDERLKFKKDAMYEWSVDLRPAKIPARLSVNHKHHKQLGPKLEIIGVGELCYSDWVSVAGMVFAGDVEEASILRADLTADVPGVKVSSFADAMWCAGKLKLRTEYGERLSTELQRLGAQTKYYGIKPRQIRIYNKTLQMAQELLPAHNRKRRAEGLKPETFEQVYGFDPHKRILTRVERQMGARETEEKWGVRRFGDVPQLMKFDPFEQLRFKVHAKQYREFDQLQSDKKIMVALLRKMNHEQGWDNVASFVREHYANGNAYFHFMSKYRGLILDAHPGLTRDMLTAEHRRSFALQLAA